MLRVLRTFRVLRLFGQLKSLRTLVNALVTSILPVVNALIVVLIFGVVYSILGVEIFGSDNPEFFGSFGRSSWTVCSCACERAQERA